MVASTFRNLELGRDLVGDLAPQTLGTDGLAMPDCAMEMPSRNVDRYNIGRRGCNRTPWIFWHPSTVTIDASNTAGRQYGLREGRGSAISASKGFGGRVGKRNRAAWTELHEHRNGCYQCPPAEVQNALRGGCHVASHYFDLVAGEVVERHPRSERNTSRMLLDEETIQPSRCLT